MTLYKNAIKVNLTDSVKHDFFHMSSEIKSYFQSTLPPEKSIALLNIDSRTDHPSFILHQLMTNPDNTQLNDDPWSQFNQNIQGSAEFFKKYSLEGMFIYVAGENVPPHAHSFEDHKSFWTITMFNNSVEGTLRFHEPTNSNNPDSNSWPCIEEIKTYPGDVYSINTSSWHSWVADDPALFTEASLFYLKNCASYEEALTSVKRLEQF